MSKRFFPDEGLKAPARPFSETFSAWTVIKKTWFPHLLTDKERRQLAARDFAKGFHSVDEDKK